MVENLNNDEFDDIDELESDESDEHCWDDVSADMEKKATPKTDADRLVEDIIKRAHDLADAKMPDTRQVKDFENELRNTPPFSGILPADIQKSLDEFKQHSVRGTIPSPDQVKDFEKRIRSIIPANADGQLPGTAEDFIHRMHRAANRNDTRLIILPGDVKEMKKNGKF